MVHGSLFRVWDLGFRFEGGTWMVRRAVCLARSHTTIVQSTDLELYRGQGLGCMVQGKGRRVKGSECRVQGAGFRVQGSGCRVQGVGFKVQGSGCRVQDLGCRVQG